MMFSFPVTIPAHFPAGVFPMDVSVPIDDIVKVTPLDNDHSFGVESNTLYSCLPSSELLFADGRKLPILETAATVCRYLDAYRRIEDFYTAPATPARNTSDLTPAAKLRLGQEAMRRGEGVVVPLFGRSPCNTSEAPTPA